MTRKIILGILGFVLILLLALGIFVLIQLDDMEPEYSGEQQIAGIEQPVTLSWDSSGVVHIRGERTSDVIFAAGYAAAKERLWQMFLIKKMARGELSQIFGDTTLQVDKLFLTLGLDSLTERLYRNSSAESREWLKLYAGGINAYLREIGDNYPIEFILLRTEPGEWSAEDCLLQNRLMAWFLNFNWKADIFYRQLQQKVSAGKFKEILPHWRNQPFVVPPDKKGDLSMSILKLEKRIRQITGITTGAAGSNNWVIGPQKSAGGKAMLANDPHLTLTMPSVWFEMHLQSSDMNVAGFTFPGTPGVVIGRNENIAWGVTNGMIDDSDYFVEKIDTVDEVYWRNKKQLPLQVENRLIKVKHEPERYFTIYRTADGPVMNPVFPDLSLSQFLVLKWVGWENSDEIRTFIELSRAKNWQDFKNALRYYTVPAQNFVYADKAGNIGYKLGGKIPIRSYGKGLLPVNVSSGKNKWTSWVKFKDNPELYNPQGGWIATANNKIAADFPYYLSELWEPPYRIRRIEQRIGEIPELTATDMQHIQMDVKNLMAEELLPVIINDLKSIRYEDSLTADALLILENWDYAMTTGTIAPTIYETIQLKLIKNIFYDEMGASVFSLFTDLPNFYLRIFAGIFQQKDSPWFDDVGTSPRERRFEIVQKSFSEAVVLLRDSLHLDMEEWRWGDLHTVTLKHILGQNALTERIFNSGTFPAAGDGVTVNVGSYPYAKPYQMTVGASMRFIVDWSAADSYRSILPGGNSGNFLSRFYLNQVRPWLKGRLKTVNMADRGTKERLRLLPE